MNLVITLNDINIPTTYNMYYVFSEIGSNLNVLDTINLIQIQGDFNGTTQVINLTSVVPLNKEIWILVKEKNGNKYISKNFYVHGEDYFEACIDCCSFDGGSVTFNGWVMDCTFGVGTVGEVICRFDGGSTHFNGWMNDCSFGVGVVGETICRFENGTTTFNGWATDCTFNVGVIGEVICRFDGGSTHFNGYNVDCTFGMYVDDANVRPESKITRDSAGFDTSDLIDGSSNMPLYCQYITTYNGTSISSAVWQFKPISMGGSWINSSNVVISQLQNYPTNMEDFEFRVKVTDSNGLVGYSNVISKYYIPEPNKKYEANISRMSDAPLDICSNINTQVLLHSFPPQIGDTVYDINDNPLNGYYYCRIADINNGFDKTFNLDPSNGKIIDNFICQ